MDATEAAPAPWLASGTRGSVGKPPRILRLVDHYPPAYKAGGPLRSVSNLVERLSDEFEFWVVTRDRDLGDAVPLPGIRAGVWTRSGRALVYYAAPWGLSPAALRRLARALFSLVEPFWTNMKRSYHEGVPHVRYIGYSVYCARC